MIENFYIFGIVVALENGIDSKPLFQFAVSTV